MRPTVVVSSPLSRLGAAVVTALGVALLAVEAVQGGTGNLLRSLPWVALVSLVCWLMWGVARILATDDAVVLDNPLVRTSIGWDAVTCVTNHWGVRVEAAGRSHQAWAAPGRGGLGTGWGRRGQSGGTPAWQLPVSAAAHSPIRLDLGAREAALMLDEQRAQRSGQGHTAVSRSPRWERIGLLTVLVMLCAATMLL